MRHPLVIAATAIWLGGCAGKAAQNEDQDMAPGELLQGIEIDLIGRNRVHLREFQVRAMSEAVAYAMARGVARERIERITLETVGGARSGASSGRRGGGRRSATRFTVWLRIADCESSVFFRASATGRIVTPQDKSDCLTLYDGPVQ